MLEPDHATDLAIIDPKASQQVDGAIAHIFELAACRPTACAWPTRCQRSTGHRRLVGRGWSTYPDARLLIDTEQRPIDRWVEQQLNNGHGFGGELGVAVVHPGVKDGPGEPMPLEDDADGALAGTAQAKFGMGGNVL